MDTVYEVFDHEASMEPMLPSMSVELRETAGRLVQRTARLGGVLHPVTRMSVVALVRQMNSYYSNLIEGHNTHPADIERAMREEYARDSAKRALQIESRAHIEVQELIENRLSREQVAICGREFLCWIHREFYARLPDEFRIVTTKAGNKMRVEPGQVRDCEVEIGRHVAPTHRRLDRFLDRFATAYDMPRMDPLDRAIAAASAHHRLTWIHPFLDGNGRVARLFTHAWLIQCGMEGHGLWTMSRGFARSRDVYISALAAADRQRENDLDGRGNLSERGLMAFCRFFLETALDQVEFMAGLFDLDSILKRIAHYAERCAVETGTPTIETARVLTELFLRGEMARGDMSWVTGKPERTTRRILGRLLEDGLVVSDTPKGLVRLGFPVKAIGYYFPRLYPEGVELGAG